MAPAERGEPEASRQDERREKCQNAVHLMSPTNCLEWLQWLLV